MRSEDPKTCCDEDCAAVNDCQIGGLRCHSCGWYFCAHELDENGLCAECAGEAEEDE